MKAFISYSHKDHHWLEKFHIHLAHLRRDGKLDSWTDEQIPTGSKIDNAISGELTRSQIFFALLSPDYIASSYCYDREFKKALELHDEGKITIIPIVLEPCDWLNTPFSDFKALPRDGKPVSAWENANNAFLDIVQNIRSLVGGDSNSKDIDLGDSPTLTTLPRNYRVKRDFDSIQKLEFVESTFLELKDILSRYLIELSKIDSNVKSRTLINTEAELEYLLVNRNKIGTEAELHVSIKHQSNSIRFNNANEKNIGYKIVQGQTIMESVFVLAFDDYHMFWSEAGFSYYSQGKQEWDAKEMTDKIWNDWLESVGII